jgi:two-component system chemotaxis response regulator CheB
LSGERVRVLIVEDSPVVREFLVHILQGDPGVDIVGTAADGREALQAVRDLRPDVVTMDVHMPGMDGLQATRHLMHESPVPVVIVSGTLKDQVDATFHALEAGALAFVPKPVGLGDPRHARESADLVRTVKLMSEVKVVRRRAPGDRLAGERAEEPLAAVRVVGIGASTGGPVAIQALLDRLLPGLPVPVLVVQHIAEGFLDGFLQWLNRTSPNPVQLAVHAQTALPGRIYVAPDGAHLGIDRNLRIVLSDGPPEAGVRPSVSHLFRSIHRTCGGAAAAVLLSGMGRDGANELLQLKRSGAHTFVQDQASCVVHGMPGAALKLDAARYIMAPAEIGAVLDRLLQRRAGAAGTRAS